MDLDIDLFFYCWGEFLKCSAGVYAFSFISKINPHTEIRDRNLSPSKVVTFLYVGMSVVIHSTLLQTCIIITFSLESHKSFAPENSSEALPKMSYFDL